MIVGGIKFMVGKTKIGIIPTIRENHSTLEFCVDRKLIAFVKKISPQAEIQILFERKTINMNLIISSGGNTLYELSKKDKDKKRESLDSYYLNFAHEQNISFIGICFGAQFIAKKYGSEIKKICNHVILKHKIIGRKKTLTVNSYHDYGIFKLGKKLEKIFWASDNSIELFKLSDKNIYGMMWHPERYKLAKSHDCKLFRDLL